MNKNFVKLIPIDMQISFIKVSVYFISLLSYQKKTKKKFFNASIL